MESPKDLKIDDNDEIHEIDQEIKDLEDEIAELKEIGGRHDEVKKKETKLRDFKEKRNKYHLTNTLNLEDLNDNRNLGESIFLSDPWPSITDYEEKFQEKQGKEIFINEDEKMQVERLKQEEQEKEKKEDLRKKIKVLESELELIPHCAEKSLLTLNLYLKKIILEGNQDFQIKEEIDKLKKCLEQEGLLSNDVNELLESAISAFVRKDWKESSTEFEKLLSYIRPISIPELRRETKNLDEAASKIKGKDIILFLGQTGTGKSTTIHFLAGSKMRKTSKNGLDHIEPYEVRNPELEKITTSPGSSSETLYITAVEVDYKGDSYFLCDSPGFGDTRGEVIDIANGLGIFKAIGHCKSVRPVIVISEKSFGERFIGLREIAHLLTKMIKNFSGEVGNFSFLFTKYKGKIEDL
jgi:hypothetical protein